MAVKTPNGEEIAQALKDHHEKDTVRRTDGRRA